MALEKNRILIVDDVPNNLKLLGNILRNSGYKISFAENGIKALEIIEYKEFDLILLDIMMPEIDGFEVLKKLKQNPDTANLPVIMLSAKNDSRSMVKCFTSGAVDYVTKPYQQEELLARISTHLQLKNTQKMLEDELKEHQKAKIKLQEYVDRVQLTNDELEEKNLELAAAQEELSETIIRLRKANTQKDKLFSIIAHDLRGPIGAISMSLELYLKDEFDVSFSTQMLSELEKSAKSTYNLLENLLFWARSQRKELDVNFKDVILTEIIENNLDLLESSAKHKKISLVSKLQNNFVVSADYNLLTTIIRNLISNAIKFTPANGEITVCAEEQKDNCIVISVSDTGIGMDETVLQKIFDSELRYSTVGTNEEKGTGLGLMLCKEFAIKNGGNIWVESEVGKGSTFYFTVKNAN